MSSSQAHRTATVRRATSESTVEVTVDLDGTGRGEVSTGVRFYDHMLLSLAKHSLIDLTVHAEGDVDVDAHHTVEDVVAGRPYVVHEGEPTGQEYVIVGGSFVGSLTRHVWESLATNAGLALHVRVVSGRDPHHVIEAQFKAVARALRAAVARDPRVEGVPSAKGAL